MRTTRRLKAEEIGSETARQAVVSAHLLYFPEHVYCLHWAGLHQMVRVLFPALTGH